MWTFGWSHFKIKLFHSIIHIDIQVNVHLTDCSLPCYFLNLCSCTLSTDCLIMWLQQLFFGNYSQMVLNCTAHGPSVKQKPTASSCRHHFLPKILGVKRKAAAGTQQSGSIWGGIWANSILLWDFSSGLKSSVHFSSQMLHDSLIFSNSSPFLFCMIPATPVSCVIRFIFGATWQLNGRRKMLVISASVWDSWIGDDKGGVNLVDRAHTFICANCQPTKWYFGQKNLKLTKAGLKLL